MKRGVTIPAWVIIGLGALILIGVAVGATLLITQTEEDGEAVERSSSGDEADNQWDPLPADSDAPAVRYPQNLRQEIISGCTSGGATLPQCTCAADELAKTVPASKILQQGGAFASGNVPANLKAQFVSAVQVCQ